jgi:hypothetical protein
MSHSATVLAAVVALPACHVGMSSPQAPETNRRREFETMLLLQGLRRAEARPWSTRAKRVFQDANAWRGSGGTLCW